MTIPQVVIELTNFGCANGWTQTPAIVRACRDLGHIPQDETIRPCLHRVTCPECKYFYTYDSSD